MQETRVGIIGCGNIARSHVDGYQKSGAVVTAVTDVRPGAAEAFVRELPGARVFPDTRTCSTPAWSTR